LCALFILYVVCFSEHVAAVSVHSMFEVYTFYLHC